METDKWELDYQNKHKKKFTYHHYFYWKTLTSRSPMQNIPYSIPSYLYVMLQMVDEVHLQHNLLSSNEV